MTNQIGKTPQPSAPLAPKRAAAGTATFNYNSQDSTVFSNGTLTLNNVSQGQAPSTPMVKLNSPLAPSSPGQYVFQEGDPKEVAANAFAAVAHTVDDFGQAIGQPIKWAFNKPQLGVNYDEGDDLNAYYARQDTGQNANDGGAVNFFHHADAKTGQTIYSGDSGEAVSHETGHAILDSFRPAYFSSFTPDVAAFHEAMGDMMGICMSFQDPRSIDEVIKQTGDGDLSKQNCIAGLDEQIGTAINDEVGPSSPAYSGGDFLRNALNNFKYSDPSTMDQNGDATHIGSEAHSMSRLWTGAFYDVLTAINKENLAANPGDPKAALTATGKEAIQLLAEIVKGAPQGDFTFPDMANAWIAADKQYNGGKRADIISQVMANRNMLSASQSAPSGGNPPVDPGDGGDDSLATKHLFSLTPEGMKPLGDLTHPVTVKMGTNVPDPFQGAKVTTLVDNDGALEKDADVANRTRQSVANLIKAGRILVTTPGQKLTTRDYFDKQGEPYMGVLTYNADGSKTIERVKIAS